MSGPWNFGSCSYDGKILARDGQARPLQPKAGLLLELLLEKPGKDLSDAEIINRLWPGDQRNLTSNIRVLFSAVRQAVGKDLLPQFSRRLISPKHPPSPNAQEPVVAATASCDVSVASSHWNTEMVRKMLLESPRDATIKILVTFFWPAETDLVEDVLDRLLIGSARTIQILMLSPFPSTRALITARYTHRIRLTPETAKKTIERQLANLEHYREELGKYDGKNGTLEVRVHDSVPTLVSYQIGDEMLVGFLLTRRAFTAAPMLKIKRPVADAINGTPWGVFEENWEACWKIAKTPSEVRRPFSGRPRGRRLPEPIDCDYMGNDEDGARYTAIRYCSPHLRKVYDTYVRLEKEHTPYDPKTYIRLRKGLKRFLKRGDSHVFEVFGGNVGEEYLRQFVSAMDENGILSKREP